MLYLLMELSEVKIFIPAYTVKRFNSTHDGANVMIKTSKLLKVQRGNHCVTSALHLLLTTNSIKKVPSVMAVLEKCNTTVSSIHFKSDDLEQKVRYINNQAAFSDLIYKISYCSVLIDSESM